MFRVDIEHEWSLQIQPQRYHIWLVFLIDRCWTLGFCTPCRHCSVSLFNLGPVWSNYEVCLGYNPHLNSLHSVRSRTTHSYFVFFYMADQLISQSLIDQLSINWSVISIEWFVRYLSRCFDQNYYPSWKIILFFFNLQLDYFYLFMCIYLLLLFVLYGMYMYICIYMMYSLVVFI